MKQMAMDGGKVILPHDIIIDILKRLPVKSLIRFRSVCKDWKYLIKTPSFIAEHLNHSNHKNPFLLLQRFHPRHDYLPLCLLDCKMEVLELQNPPLIDSLSPVRIVGSSNGLLCLRYTDDGRSPRPLLLCNPAIREVRHVPRTINDFRGFCCLGFGFSPIVNDYKILAIDVSHFYDVNRVEVYSLSTGSWKEVEFGNIQGVCLECETVIANGAMFWLGFKKDATDEDEGDLVVSFDIAMEVFTLIPMPASSSELEHKLIVFENTLAMFSHSVIGGLQASVIDLWVMEEDTSAFGENGNWTKKYSTLRPSSGLFFPLSIWRNKIISNVIYVDQRPTFIDEAESDGEQSVLSLLNPTTSEFEKLDTFGYGYHYLIFNYAESLVPVDNMNGLALKS